VIKLIKKIVMKFLVLLLAFVAVVASVSAHAVLRDPVPWNTNPSTSNPCGGGTNTNTPVLTVKYGQQVTLKWEVVAADGAGPVTMTIDPAGGQNFGTTGVKVPLTGTVPTGVALYTFSATIPTVKW
jgi:hypothetical protein